MCPCLFYLDEDDYIDDDLVAADALVVIHSTNPAVQEPAATANSFVVSLRAVTRIQLTNSMLLPITL